MFSFLQKEKKGKEATFAIQGMHCVSCSVNIDGELEDTPGVFEATTSYAGGKTIVRFDESKVDTKELQTVIEKLGYTAELGQSST